MAKNKTNNPAKGRDIPLPESKVLRLEPLQYGDIIKAKKRKESQGQAEKDAESFMKEARKKLDNDFQESLKKGYGK